MGLVKLKMLKIFLTGVKYDKASLEEAIDQIDVKKILWKYRKKEDLLGLIY